MGLLLSDTKVNNREEPTAAEVAESMHLPRKGQTQVTVTTQTDFDNIVRHRLQSCEGVLTAKGKEYSGEGDRLHNFKIAGAMQCVSPGIALRGMWSKHLVSIMDMFVMIEAGDIPSREMVAEKLGDNINYSLLFEALIEELRRGEGGKRV